MAGPFRLRRAIATLGILLLGCAGVYIGSQGVLSGNYAGMGMLAAACAGTAILVYVLNHWRRGLYAFLVWLCIEDLIRKYLGNNMAIFFAKDALLVVVYLSFFLAWRRREMKAIRPPFWIPLLVFIWFGVLQIFNPNSPSIWYGLLGLKIDFFYVPLFFVGYALLRNETELRRFYYVFIGVLFMIVSLGIAQSIIGPTFLNPSTLQADIRELGALYRTVQGTGEVLYRPTSVFVSAGRFMNFLAISWLLILGFSAYLLLRTFRGRLVVFSALILTAAGIVLCGARGTFGWGIINGTAVALAILWSAKWKQAQARRALRIIHRVALATALAMTLLVTIFPEAVASRLDLYSKTLSPTSSRSELNYRAWDYPVQNFLKAFDFPDWPYGYGIGTASLGTQYVARILHAPPPPGGVESGFGVLIVEMGVAGLALWFLMTAAILWSSWKVVRGLRGSPFFPLGFVIFWYAAMLLLPMTFVGMQNYQDFLMNAYLWLLLGILFRLPAIATNAHAAPAAGIERPAWNR